MADKELSALKALAEAATPGPWANDRGYLEGPPRSYEECYFTHIGDAEYIAAANPAAILSLISRLEQVEAASSERANNAIDQTIISMQENSAQGGNTILDRYDAGSFNDFGGGNVEWWWDYLRAELDRAYDFYQSQADNFAISAATSSKPSDDAMASVDELLYEHARAVVAAYEHGETSTYYDDLKSAEQDIRDAFANRAQLTRQQAPVGDSVDSPEFSDLLDNFFAAERDSYDFDKDGSLNKAAEAARAALIAHITAWKDAQLARERQGQGGMHAAADYIDKKAEDYINENADAEYDTGATVWRYGGAGRDYYNSLVELAEELRAATPQGEPVAKPYAYEYGKSNGDGTYSVVIDRGDMVKISETKYEYGPPKNAIKDRPVKSLYLWPAPQADEVRVRELEAALRQKNDSTHREREKLMGHITKLETALWRFGKEGEAALAAIRSAPTHSPQADEGNVK